MVNSGEPSPSTSQWNGVLDRLSIPLIVFGIIGILFGICGGFFSKSHYVQKQEEQNRPQGSIKGTKLRLVRLLSLSLELPLQC